MYEHVGFAETVLTLVARWAAKVIPGMSVAEQTWLGPVRSFRALPR
jgi:hypothetical protein